jgi:uncharacterized lipoprotein YmbA
MTRVLAALLPLLLAACAHSPDQTFFALSSQPGSATQSRALKVELRRTGLPGYLDRPHIVRRATAERLELGGDERWGAPLDEMVAATLGENLAQRLPNCVVFTDAGAISAVADVRVEVQVFQFERTANGETVLLAEVAVQSTSDAPAILQRFALHEKPTSGSAAALVSSMSNLLGALADQIAPVVLRQAPRAQEQLSPATPPAVN